MPKNEAVQMESAVPGETAGLVAAADQRVNDAVLLVQEAEEALRRARRAERLARAQAAELRRL